MCAVFAMTGVHYVFHTVKPDALSALLMQILCHFSTYRVVQSTLECPTTTA